MTTAAAHPHKTHRGPDALTVLIAVLGSLAVVIARAAGATDAVVLALGGLAASAALSGRVGTTRRYAAPLGPIPAGWDAASIDAPRAAELVRRPGSTAAA